MEETSGKRKVDWLLIIPLILWIGCIGISLSKIWQSDHIVSLLDILDAFGSSTFSTFISIVVGMAYQYFSEKNKNNPEKSGLSRSHIELTVVATIFYGIIAVINACIYNLITAWIMAVCSVLYVILFFKYMKIKGDK